MSRRGAQPPRFTLRGPLVLEMHCFTVSRIGVSSPHPFPSSGLWASLLFVAHSAQDETCCEQYSVEDGCLHTVFPVVYQPSGCAEVMAESEGKQRDEGEAFWQDAYDRK